MPEAHVCAFRQMSFSSSVFGGEDAAEQDVVRVCGSFEPIVFDPSGSCRVRSVPRLARPSSSWGGSTAVETMRHRLQLGRTL